MMQRAMVTGMEDLDGEIAESIARGFDVTVDPYWLASILRDRMLFAKLASPDVSYFARPAEQIEAEQRLADALRDHGVNYVRKSEGVL